MNTIRSPRSGEVCHVLVEPSQEENNPASHSRRGVVEYYVRRTTPIRNQGWFVRFDEGGSQGGIWRDMVVISDDPAFDALESVEQTNTGGQPA